MNTLMKKILLLSSFLFFCTLSSWAQTVEPINQERAIELAKEHAISSNSIDPNWFGGKVNATFDEGKWMILFEGKADENGYFLIGNHFFAYVSADGTEIKLSTGL